MIDRRPFQDVPWLVPQYQLGQVELDYWKPDPDCGGSGAHSTVWQSLVYRQCLKHRHEQLTAPAVLLLATRGCSSKWIPISCHVKKASVTALNVYSVNTLNVINSGSKTLMTRDQKAKTSECDYVCLLYTVCGLFLCRLSSRAPIMTEKHSRFPSRLNVSIMGA